MAQEHGHYAATCATDEARYGDLLETARQQFYVPQRIIGTVDEE